MVFLLIMVASWVVVQSTWLKRELVDGIFKRAHFQEREFIFSERESVQESVLVFKLSFQTPPNGCLDQLDPMLGSGCCFVALPNQ